MGRKIAGLFSWVVISEYLYRSVCRNHISQSGTHYFDFRLAGLARRGQLDADLLCGQCLEDHGAGRRSVRVQWK